VLAAHERLHHEVVESGALGMRTAAIKDLGGRRDRRDQRVAQMRHRDRTNEP
jgi:hypothetical protein